MAPCLKSIAALCSGIVPRKSRCPSSRNKGSSSPLTHHWISRELLTPSQRPLAVANYHSWRTCIPPNPVSCQFVNVFWGASYSPLTKTEPLGIKI